MPAHELDQLVTTELNPRLSPAKACIFLDVDGTLIDFGPAPDAVEIDAALMQLLHTAAKACGGAVALISGRSLAQLDTLFAPHRWPAAGLHGVERRDADGRLHVHPSEALPRAVLEELQVIARRHPGILVEDKGRAAALHYRQAAGMQAVLEQEVHTLARRHGDDLQVQPGAYVLELKPAGITKAHAIEAFLAERPFAGRTPLFAGDDLTDLPGFDAVERLGGVSIAVGPRVTASMNVAAPGDLRELLAGFVARGAGG